MRCLFVLGAHRSGTTWLHQLLASSNHVAYLSYGDLRQALHSGQAPLNNKELEQELKSNGGDRGFDGVHVGVDLPEEYGFLLEKRVFEYFATRPISNTDFAPLQPLIAQKQKQHPERPYLVLKNPVDFYDGALRLIEAFPGCVLLCLHRHPWAVFRSQVNAWRALTDCCNPYLASLDSHYAQVMADRLQRTALQFALRQRRGLEALLDSLVEGCTFHWRHQATLGSAGLRLRYEDLCNDPSAELKRLGAALGLSGLSAPKQQLNVHTRQLSDDPLARDLFRAHAHRFTSYCEWLGYSLEPSAAP